MFVSFYDSPAKIARITNPKFDSVRYIDANNGTILMMSESKVAIGTNNFSSKTLTVNGEVSSSGLFISASFQIKYDTQARALIFNYVGS